MKYRGGSIKNHSSEKHTKIRKGKNCEFYQFGQTVRQIKHTLYILFCNIVSSLTYVPILENRLKQQRVEKKFFSLVCAWNKKSLQNKPKIEKENF